MKTIGLIGGTSWVSTVEYYTNINRMINERLGRNNSGRIILYSVNFEEFNPPLNPDDWNDILLRFSDIAVKLETAGAECLLICANTPHIIAGKLQESINIPLIHIAEMTADAILKEDIKKVALLGTKVTMEQSFFKDKLAEKEIETIIPNAADRDFIHTSIFEELGKGIFRPGTKKRYLQIIDELKNQGAEGVILGCTEIPLIIKQSDVYITTFDTTHIHSKAAVDFAVG